MHPMLTMHPALRQFLQILRYYVPLFYRTTGAKCKNDKLTYPNQCDIHTHGSFFLANGSVRLGLDLGLGGAAADALGLGALEVLDGDPGLVVDLGTGDGRAISANNGDLLGGVDLLGAGGRLLRALAALATAPLLGEEGGDPGVVDEVNGSAESAEEDEVEEDTGECGQQEQAMST